MPTIVKTPRIQQPERSIAEVVTRETSLRRSTRRNNEDGNISDGTCGRGAGAFELFPSNADSLSDDGAAATAAIVGSDADNLTDEVSVAAAAAIVGMRSQGSAQEVREEQAIAAAFVAGAKTSRRSSKRIQEKQSENDRNNKKMKDTKIKDKKVSEEEVKLGGWLSFHTRTKTKQKRKRGIYIIMMPDGTFKVGYVYCDDATSRTLDDRIREIMVHHRQPVQYKFLDTGNLVSEDGVRRMERIAHFALFSRNTTDGKSLYVGSGEQFEASTEICDELLQKLYQYVFTNKFTWALAGIRQLRVTAKAVENKTHPKWIHFAYKTGLSKHTHRDCPWKYDDDGNVENWEDYINFARGGDMCQCMKDAKEKKKRKRN